MNSGIRSAPPPQPNASAEQSSDRPRKHRSLAESPPLRYNLVVPGLAELLVILLEGDLFLLPGLLDGDALVRVRGGVHDDGGQEHEVPQRGDGARSEQRLVVRRRRGDEVRPRRLVCAGGDQFLHEAHGGCYVCISIGVGTAGGEEQQWDVGLRWRYGGRSPGFPLVVWVDGQRVMSLNLARTGKKETTLITAKARRIQIPARKDEYQRSAG